MEASLLETSYVRPGTDVRWVVEVHGIMLFKSNDEPNFLSYPEASIWDFINRGYAPTKIVELLCAIGQIEKQAAEGFYSECVNGLVESGYLERTVDG
jgi:hypothetical protein